MFCICYHSYLPWQIHSYPQSYLCAFPNQHVESVQYIVVNRQLWYRSWTPSFFFITTASRSLSEGHRVKVRPCGSPTKRSISRSWNHVKTKSTNSVARRPEKGYTQELLYIIISSNSNVCIWTDNCDQTIWDVFVDFECSHFAKTRSVRELATVQ